VSEGLCEGLIVLSAVDRFGRVADFSPDPSSIRIPPVYHGSNVPIFKLYQMSRLKPCLIPYIVAPTTKIIVCIDHYPRKGV